MADTNSLKQTFSSLATGAQSGQLLIEDGVAKKCADRCNEYIKDLQKLARETRNLIRKDSFGDLGSAQKLATKFGSLSEDTAVGSGSFSAALADHIAALQSMADMFTKADQAFTNSDEATKDQIRQAMKNLDSSK